MSRQSEREAYNNAVLYLIKVSDDNTDDIEKMKWFIRNNIKRPDNIRKLLSMVELVDSLFEVDRLNPKNVEIVDVGYKAAQALHDTIGGSDENKDSEMMKFLTKDRNG